MKSASCPGYPASVRVDLDAVTTNVRRMQELAGDAIVLAVVKANGYGLGRTVVAEHLWKQGIRWFGAARVPEAIALRKSLTSCGADPSDTHILSWLNSPDGHWDAALDNGLDVSVSTETQLSQIVETVRSMRSEGIAQEPARIHLKVDTGMGRGGATSQEQASLAAAVKAAVDAGFVQMVGLWSHLAYADDPEGAGAKFTAMQVERFEEATEVFRAAGLEPHIRHLSATAGTIWHPEARYDMVRVGIGLYGLSPNPDVATAADLGLHPAASLCSRLSQVKLLGPGDTVSYGGTWVAPDQHWVGLLPIGYADGVPRALSNRALAVAHTDHGLVQTRILGRVCMDQIVIDLGNGEEPVAPSGAQITLFGDPERGEPSIDDWANQVGTINYEIVSRIPEHIDRIYVCEEDA